MSAVPFRLLIAFLVIVAFTGGASRSDVQSLVILRPLSMLFCGIGLWSLTHHQIRAFRPLFICAATFFVLVILELIPLPPEIWSTLPGRHIIAEIDKAAELGRVWRPISMVPYGTWNALCSLFVPMAVLVLGVQLSREERFKLLHWLLGLGLLSGLWGILQIVGEPGGPLYLYNVTNQGSAVGLFSNRNHQAIMLACLFPMLAVYAATSVRSEEQAGLKLWLSIGAGAVIVPLLLVTGSRAGLVLGVIGLLFVPLLYRKLSALNPKKRTMRKFDPRYVFATFTILLLGCLTLVMSRAEAFQRLFAAGPGEDDRFKVWVPIAEMAWKYFPVGSGIGSFVEVYQIDEPYSLLSTEYYNHAHNDWLEVYFTLGIIGIFLLLIAVIFAARTAIGAFRAPDGRDVTYAKLGSAIMLMFALGSIGDYPLRVPFGACYFVVAAMWLTAIPAGPAKRHGVGVGLGLNQTPSS
jgi:O-antigen ligase